jgi:UDP-3-O-[3-hydroxymyristoyl] glucosamine N-acyltransferase
MGLENTVNGPEDLSIAAVNTLEDAVPGEISFLSNPRYRQKLAATKASAVLVDRTVELPEGVAGIRSDNPYAALCMTIIKVHGYRRHPRWRNARPVIAESAVIGENANIAHTVTIAENVAIGRNATIYPGCYIGDGCQLGDDVILYPNVVVYDYSVIGHRVAIHAGTVIGEDGLGYAPVGEKWAKIPQVGRVIVHDDVEIGANCAIDRATLGSTEIGSGGKFSNLVTVGHGTKVGSDAMIVAQVGIAGSAVVGRHVTMAGQAGIVGHVEIGDNATIGAQAGVKNDVAAGITVLGSPAGPITETKRQMLAIQRLPEMRKQMKDMQARMDQLARQIEELQS